MSSINDEPFNRWPISMTLRCARIGLTPAQILAVQVLSDLPEQEGPGIVWMSAETLADRLYASSDESHQRAARLLLAGLVAAGYLSVAIEHTPHKSKRYDLTQLRAWVASVDVTDVFKKAAPPVWCAVPAPTPRTKVKSLKKRPTPKNKKTRVAIVPTFEPAPEAPPVVAEPDPNAPVPGCTSCMSYGRAWVPGKPGPCTLHTIVDEVAHAAWVASWDAKKVA